MPRTSTTLSTDVLSLGIRITIQTFKKAGDLENSSILLLKILSIDDEGTTLHHTLSISTGLLS